MALTFPASPTTGQTYTYNGDNYTFDGKRWTKPSSGTGVAASTQIEFLRGTATTASASAITANEGGTVLLAKQESSDDTWYSFNGTNTLIINRAGILTIDLNQDIKTSTNTGYSTITIYKNSGIVHKQLVQNTNGEWDCAVTSHYTEVVPGDVIDIVFSSPVDIVMLDPGIWSYYNFMLIENNDTSGSMPAGSIVQVAHGIATQAVGYEAASFNLTDTDCVLTPKRAGSKFLITFQAATNTTDDGYANQNPYFSGTIQRKVNAGAFTTADMLPTGIGNYRSGHMELSPNRTGNEQGGTYEQGQRYRSKQHTVQIVDQPTYTLGDALTYSMLVTRYSGTYIRFGEPAGYLTDEIYPTQVYGFTIMEIAQ